VLLAAVTRHLRTGRLLFRGPSGPDSQPSLTLHLPALPRRTGGGPQGSGLAVPDRVTVESGPVVIRQGEAVELKSGSRIAAMCEQYENGLIESIRKCIDFSPSVKKPARWRARHSCAALLWLQLSGAAEAGNIRVRAVERLPSTGSSPVIGRPPHVLIFDLRFRFRASDRCGCHRYQVRLGCAPGKKYGDSSGKKFSHHSFLEFQASSTRA
jgi:hypothetical protein